MINELQIGSRVQNCEAHILSLTERLKGIDDRTKQLGEREKIPSQRIAGAVDFPDLRAEPFIANIEMADTNGLGYANQGSQVQCYGKIILDEHDVTYITHIGFDLVRTAGAGKLLNTYLPLSSWNFISDGVATYQGHDFRWNFVTSVDRIYVTNFGFLSSALCENEKRAYKLESEFYVKAKNSINIFAQPIGQSAGDEEFQLIANVYGYRMKLKQG